MARYWLRTGLGIAIIAGSVALASVCIYHLTRSGSCASGGAYVIANPCPDGTGLRILGLIGGIFVLPFAGMGVLATRHRGSGRTIGAVGVLWFLLLFTCMGAAALVAGDGPAAPSDPGTRAAARWVAGTFLVIGAPGLLLLLAATARGAARDRR